MNKEFYYRMADNGIRIPIAADLVLHSKPDHEDILLNGIRLGQVLEETAKKYNNPLAIPLMDLMLEKTIMLKILGIDDRLIGPYHFSVNPTREDIDKIKTGIESFITERMKADIEAIKYIDKETDLLPVGMSIGPFSLLTKLVSDPITPVYLAGSGVTPEDDDEIFMLETLLYLSVTVIERYIDLKIETGAKAILVAEPAANLVYFSPKQIEEGSDIFDRYVIDTNKRLAEKMKSKGVELIFHCCGELNEIMLRKFTELQPIILTLGGSRVLWEDADVVPKDIILFGNIPSKKFYSDDEITSEEVKSMSRELIKRMGEKEHPFILGTECDVLFVKGAEDKINSKVDAMMIA